MPSLSAEEETRYREHFLPYDIVQIRLGVLLALLPNLFLIFNDYEFLGGTPLFIVVLSFRLITALVSIIFCLYLKRIKNFDSYDRLMSVWLTLVLLTLVAVNITRPNDYYMYVVIDVLYVMVIYIVFISRFVIQAALALAATLIDIGVLFLAKDVPDMALRVIIVAFVLANGLGWLLLFLINRARRQEFLSHEVEIKVMKENQRLEAERNQQSRLESVGILADAVAVDFRTMLSGALDSLDASRKELEVLNTDGARLKLTEAQASLRRGNAINNQLLAFTRGGETRKGTINLELAIRKSVYQCLEGTKIAFILNLDHDLWRTSGDSEHLVHAFSNILGFVRRENPKEIKVRARNIMREVHGFEGAGKYIVTQIEDNGQGIPADRLEHIFDPFYGTRENNLSLDLPVAHSIIKKHGGLIDVETIAGGGNIFYIYLPAAV